MDVKPAEGYIGMLTTLGRDNWRAQGQRGRLQENSSFNPSTSCPGNLHRRAGIAYSQKDCEAGSKWSRQVISVFRHFVADKKFGVFNSLI